MAKSKMPNSNYLIRNTEYRILNTGFTLIELLIVMAIMGILATLLVGGFQTAQMRGRDSQRKSDLKQLSNSLELFYNDYGFYPADSSGLIVGCPYLASGSSIACSWGAGQFTDNKTTYFKKMPSDPSGAQIYFYRVVPGSGNKKYQVFAHLENPKDPGCLNGDCANPGVSYACGSGRTCNFAITSANTGPTE